MDIDIFKSFPTLVLNQTEPLPFLLARFFLALIFFFSIILVLRLLVALPLQILLKGIALFLTFACAVVLILCVLCLQFLFLAKVVLAVMLVSGCFLVFYVISLANSWYTFLFHLEESCIELRDSLMVRATVIRSQLAAAQEHLEKGHQAKDKDLLKNIFKLAAPLVMLVLQKERNFIKWAIAVSNIGKVLFFSKEKSRIN